MSRNFHDLLAEPKIKAEDLYDRLVKNQKYVEAVVEGLDSSNKRVKNRSAKLLKMLSADHPRKLKKYYARFVELLNSKDSILKWNAVAAVGNISRHLKPEEIEKLLPRLIRISKDKKMITGNLAVEALGKIAAKHTEVRERITRALISASGVKHDTAECDNIFKGKIIAAFDQYMKKPAEVPKKAVAFAQTQLKSRRNAVKTRAKKFLSRLEDVVGKKGSK